MELIQVGLKMWILSIRQVNQHTQVSNLYLLETPLDTIGDFEHSFATP